MAGISALLQRKDQTSARFPVTSFVGGVIETVNLLFLASPPRLSALFKKLSGAKGPASAIILFLLYDVMYLDLLSIQTIVLFIFLNRSTGKNRAVPHSSALIGTIADLICISRYL